MAFAAVIVGGLGFVYPWATIVGRMLSLVAVLFGLSSILGFKWVRKCILLCWCGERHNYMTHINSWLSVVSNLVHVDFVVDENGIAYSAVILQEVVTL